MRSRNRNVANSAPGGPSLQLLRAPSNDARLVDDAAQALLPVLRLFAKYVGAEVADFIAAKQRHPETIDQHSLDELDELRLSPRRYLECARNGEFASRKRGRRIVAKYADVAAWREVPRMRRAAASEPLPAPEPMTLEDQARIELGFAPKFAPVSSRKRHQ